MGETHPTTEPLSGIQKPGNVLSPGLCLSLLNLNCHIAVGTCMHYLPILVIELTLGLLPMRLHSSVLRASYWYHRGELGSNPVGVFLSGLYL